MKKRGIGKTISTFVLIFIFLILVSKITYSETTIYIDGDKITSLEQARSSLGSMYREGGEKTFIESRNLLTNEEKSMTNEQIQSEMSNLESQGNTLERDARQQVEAYNVAAGAYSARIEEYENHQCQTSQEYRSENWDECSTTVYSNYQNDLKAPRAARDEAWDKLEELIIEVRDVRWKIIYYEIWLVAMGEELETVTNGSAGTYEPDDDEPPEEPEPTDAVKGDGKCELLQEFCFNSPDCKCHKGTRCVDNLPAHMDSSTAKQDWVGCVSLTTETQELKNQYKENIEKISKLGEDRVLLNKLFRRNLGKKIAKFVVFEAPTPTNLLGVVSDVTLSLMQKYFNKDEMTDDEILNAQLRTIQDMNTEMERLYQDNQGIKQKFNSLKE